MRSTRTTTMSIETTSSSPIVSRVKVQGRYLVDSDSGERFRMRGIAFPIAPISRTEAAPVYFPQGWIDVLLQLRESSSKLNTIRLYQLDIDTHDYSDFFETARQLGFYILVPLTTSAGAGVLNRDLTAPECYSQGLYDHGRRVVDMTWRKYPNIIGGVLANEVMNSLSTWTAAPCILSYARDLKRHEPDFPLVYTMQHDGIGAAVSPGGAVQLTLEYMTACGHIDVLGVNIESWCSSLQSFELNEDGSTGSYLDLYNHVNASSIPIIFSEDGCSTELFNRDNGLERYSRDWKQLSVIETQMSDELSGFVAYAYDGPPPFRMTQGGPWDGQHTLVFAKDMDNFIQELQQLQDDKATRPTERVSPYEPPTCESVNAHLADCCKLKLLSVDEMPSYYVPNEISLNATVHESFETTQFVDENPNIAMVADPMEILLAAVVLAIFLVPFTCKKITAWRESVVAPTTSTIQTNQHAAGRSFARNYDTFSGQVG